MFPEGIQIHVGLKTLQVQGVSWFHLSRAAGCAGTSSGLSAPALYPADRGEHFCSGRLGNESSRSEALSTVISGSGLCSGAGVTRGKCMPGSERHSAVLCAQCSGVAVTYEKSPCKHPKRSKCGFPWQRPGNPVGNTRDWAPGRGCMTCRVLWRWTPVLELKISTSQWGRLPGDDDVTKREGEKGRPQSMMICGPRQNRTKPARLASHQPERPPRHSRSMLLVASPQSTNPQIRKEA